MSNGKRYLCALGLPYAPVYQQQEVVNLRCLVCELVFLRREAGRTRETRQQNCVQTTTRMCCFQTWGESGQQVKTLRIDLRELGQCSGSAFALVTSERIVQQTEYNLEDGGDTGYRQISRRVTLW